MTLQLELPLCEWTVINDAYKEEANEWTLRNGLGPLHRAELSREDAACMALELGDKLQGTPKVQIMVQRHGNIIVVPPGFPHHVRLEALNFHGKASNVSERLPSQMSNAACHQAPSLYLTACRNSIALCSST